MKRSTKALWLSLGFVIGAGLQSATAGDPYGIPGPQGPGGGSGTATLTAIGALTPTDSNVIVGNGTTWVAESGATARTSLGLGTGDSPTFTAMQIGSADTAGVRLEVNSGALEVREGDDSAYGPILKSNQYYTMSSATTLGALIQGNNGFTLGSAYRYNFYSAPDILSGGAIDTALSRAAAGRVLVENGSGTGALLTVGAGSAAAPAITFTTVQNAGFYQDASQYPAISHNGTRAMAFGAGQALGATGSAAVPAFSFYDSANAGMFCYASGTGGLGFSTQSRPALLVGRQTTLTDNTATTIATIALASGARCGGTVRWSVDVTDGTDHQVVTGSFTFSAVDKAGTLTSDVDADATVSTAASAGTLTVTPTILDGTNQISLQITADTSLTPTAMLVRFNLDLSGTSAAIVTYP